MTKRRAVVWCWVVLAVGGVAGAVAGTAGILGPAVVAAGLIVALVGSAAGVWSAMLTRRYGQLQAADRARAAQVLRDEASGDAATRYARQLSPDVTLIDTPFLVYEVGSVRAAATRGGAHAGGGSRLDLERWGPVGAATRLVMVGPRGAGKSEAAVALTMAAVGRGPGGAARSDGPVAVVPVALDGFDERLGLARWLAREIASSSALDEAAVMTLWKAGQLVPVLDGIDQMDLPTTPPDRPRAAALLRQLNTQVVPTAALGDAPPAPGPLDGVRRPGQAMARPPVVVTCLDSTWIELQAVEPLLDAVRLELQSVSATLAEEYVHKRTGQDPRWQPLLDDLHVRRGGPLGGALSTPWGLHLAVTAFHGPGVATVAGALVVGDPDDLRRASTGEEVRDLLLANYLPAILAARGGRYSVAATQRYLVRLARWLERNAGTPALGGRPLPTTDIVVHELWPLAGRLRPRVWAAALVGLVLAGACAWAASIASGPWTTSRWSVSAVSVAGAGWMTVNTARWVWPGTSGAGPSRVWGPPAVRGRRTTTAWIAAGLTAAAVGAGVGTVASDHPAGAALGAAAGVATVVCAAPAGRRRRLPAPGAVLRAQLLSGAWVGLVGAAMTAAWWTLMFGSAAIWPALLFGAGLGLAACPAVVRYVVLLALERGRLPWRLLAFLRWASDIGLLRDHGGVYQFCHKELQEYLAS